MRVMTEKRKNHGATIYPLVLSVGRGRGCGRCPLTFCPKKLGAADRRRAELLKRLEALLSPTSTPVLIQLDFRVRGSQPGALHQR